MSRTEDRDNDMDVFQHQHPVDRLGRQQPLHAFLYQKQSDQHERDQIDEGGDDLHTSVPEGLAPRRIPCAHPAGHKRDQE